MNGRNCQVLIELEEGIDFMEEPTKRDIDLENANDALEIIELIESNLTWIQEGLMNWKICRSSKTLTEKHLRKAKTAAEQVAKYALSLKATMDLLKLPDLRPFPFPFNKNPLIQDKFPIAACGEQTNKDLSNKEML